MLAIIYEVEGEDKAATALYLDAAAFYESEGMDEQLSQIYTNMGSLFFNNDDLKMAGYYYERSLQIDQSLGDSLGIAACLINLASILNHKESYRQAQKLLFRGEKIVRTMESKNWIRRTIYEDIGNNYLYLEKFDSALIFINPVLVVFRGENDLNGMITCLTSLAMAWSGLADYSKAMECVNEATELSKQYGDFYLQKNLFAAASQVCANTKDFEQAYHFQLLYQTAADSITNGERMKTVNDLEKKYQTERKGNIQSND